MFVPAANGALVNLNKVKRIDIEQGGGDGKVGMVVAYRKKRRAPDVLYEGPYQHAINYRRLLYDHMLMNNMAIPMPDLRRETEGEINGQA